MYAFIFIFTMTLLDFFHLGNLHKSNWFSQPSKKLIWINRRSGIKMQVNVSEICKWGGVTNFSSNPRFNLDVTPPNTLKSWFIHNTFITIIKLCPGSLLPWKYANLIKFIYDSIKNIKSLTYFNMLVKLWICKVC